MDKGKLEQRVAELEQQVAKLQTKIEQLAPSTPWWERIAGTFHNDPIYRQAMKLGRQFRQSQKKTGRGSSGKRPNSRTDCKW